MSEAGERNKGDLLAECLNTIDERLGHLNPDDSDVVGIILGILLRRGYLTEAGIIAAKAIDDGA